MSSADEATSSLRFADALMSALGADDTMLLREVTLAPQRLWIKGVEAIVRDGFWCLELLIADELQDRTGRFRYRLVDVNQGGEPTHKMSMQFTLDSFFENASTTTCQGLFGSDA